MKLITPDNFPKSLLIMILGIWVCIVTVNLLDSPPKTDSVASKLLKERIERQDSITNALEIERESIYKQLDSLKSTQIIIQKQETILKQTYHEKLIDIYRYPTTPVIADSCLSSWRYKNSIGQYNLPNP